MISIFSKARSTEKGDYASSLLRAMLLFLEASALHAVDYDADELITFQGMIRATAQGLEEAKKSTDVLVMAGEAIRSIEAYNRGIEKYIKRHSTEMKAIVAMMTETLLRVMSSGQLASENLRQIEKEIKNTSQLDDIRMLKGRLGKSLESLVEETARQESVSSGVATELEKAQRAQKALEDIDVVTGLPGQKAATEFARMLLEAGRPGYIFALRLERLATINARFGFEIGNQVLTLYGQHLASRLPNDQLFRWRGPCFVAIVERPFGIDIVRAEASKIASARIEHAVENGGRSILLNLSSGWALIPILAGSNVADLAKKVEQFAFEEHMSGRTAPARVL